MDKNLNRLFISLCEFVEDSIILCNDDFLIIWANSSAKNLLKDNELQRKNFFSMPLRLNNDDFESFVEKIYLIGEYSGELVCENNAGISEIKKFQAKRFSNDIDKKMYYLLKISTCNQEEKIKLELKRTQEELRNLAIYLQNTREEERAKIARDLHDDIAQLLTILKMDLQSILMDETQTRDKIIEKIKNSVTIIDETISITRKMISELRLAVLDHLGLVPAIEHLIDEFKEKTKIDVYYEFEDNIKLSKEFEIHLFRVCQELFTNIRKHSKATKVEFVLKRVNRNLIISIKDNGIGFVKNMLQSKNSFGLIGIRERIYILNGNLDIKSSEGIGTTITISIPLEDEITNS